MSTLKNMEESTPSLLHARTFWALIALLMFFFSIQARAQESRISELRIGSKSDLLSLDPHAIAESLQLDVLGNLYEPLVSKNEHGALEAALATSWKQLGNKRWRFYLREGVRFHHGELFDADDVIYSLQRASSKDSGIQVFVGGIKRIEKINQYTVDFVLKEAIDQFPKSISFWYMISAKWCQTQICEFEKAANLDATTKHVSTSSNGTGPYFLDHRIPNQKSVFTVNPQHWSNTENFARTIEFAVITDDQVRGEQFTQNKLDIVLPLPLSRVEDVRNRSDLKLLQQAEARVLYLGLDLKSPELHDSNLRGSNPLRDRRVRLALYHAIDIDRLHTAVMKGFSKPLAIMVPPGVLGYNARLDVRERFDPDQARKLLRDAGYENGFELELSCSNDRYLNDAEICRAIADDLSKIGISVKLRIEAKNLFFKRVFAKEAGFYLLGSATNSGDAHNILFPVLGTEASDGRGELNFGGYSNTRVDQLLERLKGEKSPFLRKKMFTEILRIQKHDLPQIPVHQQVLITGVRADFQLVLTPENGIPWRFIRKQ